MLIEIGPNLLTLGGLCVAGYLGAQVVACILGNIVTRGIRR